ncbi:MAG: hypothetical protein LBC07_05750 [Elusimicrobiota bacterium]|jgi:hypothetical protein|nr:hypothetical protein [Elusimicrobiota bacterium]
MSRKELERALKLTWEQKRGFYERVKNMTSAELLSYLEEVGRKFEKERAARLKKLAKKKKEPENKKDIEAQIAALQKFLKIKEINLDNILKK